MKKIIIHENEKGLLFQNGRFLGLLEAGKHWLVGGREVEVLGTGLQLMSRMADPDALLAHDDIRRATTTVEIADGQLALHFLNGRFMDGLMPGRRAYWNDMGAHTFQIIDASDPVVGADIPRYILARLPDGFCTKVTVPVGYKARLYIDNRLDRLLDAGEHFFWKTVHTIAYDLVDTRLCQMDMAGQEMLTLDKVTLRVNFVCHYRITDYVRIVTELNNFGEQFHIAAQLALREYVAQNRLDDILASKEQMSRFVFERLKARETDFFITLADADVKDIILPGEIRDIMNTVLVAEKRAQANVITRREEVASTRSLLNTAKLMEENPTLYRLKELESIERICENVGNINVNGGDMLTQLTALLHGGTQA